MIKCESRRDLLMSVVFALYRAEGHRVEKMLFSSARVSTLQDLQLNVYHFMQNYREMTR